MTSSVWQKIATMQINYRVNTARLRSTSELPSPAPALDPPPFKRTVLFAITDNRLRFLQANAIHRAG